MRDDLDGLSQATPKVSWYFARDGQQYGPLSDVEMKKFNELGHFQVNDLVWREGFSDWLPAGAVFEIAKQRQSTP